MKPGVRPFAESGLEHFTGLKRVVKTRSINTINWIFLPKIKLYSLNHILASSNCMHMRISVQLSTLLSLQKLHPDIQTKILFLMFQNLRNHDALWEIKSVADPEGVQPSRLFKHFI